MEQATLEDLKKAVARVKELRNEIPEYKANDPESKDLINAYHATLYHLVSQVQAIKGFADHKDALAYVDEEIRAGRVE